jgi:hypothetical protein
VLTQSVFQAGTLWEYKADRRMPFGFDKEACWRDHFGLGKEAYCRSRELSEREDTCVLASTCRIDCEICEQRRRR